MMTPDLLAGPAALAHIGGELETGHLIVLAVIGIVGNTVLLAPRLFGLFVKGPLTRAVKEVAGPTARVGSITLPLRGSLTVERVEIPGLPDVTRAEAEVDLLGLRRDPVTIPRIVLTRRAGGDESPGSGDVAHRRDEAPADPVSSTGDPGLGGGPQGPSASGRRLYDVGAIVLRAADSDEAESADPEHPIGAPESSAGGPAHPIELHALVRHLIREAGATDESPQAP